MMAAPDLVNLSALLDDANPAVSLLGQLIEIACKFASRPGQPKSLNLLAVKGEFDTAGLV
jgi:hypothetical protein